MTKIFYVGSDKYINNLSEDRKEKLEKIEKSWDISPEITILNMINSDNIREIIDFSKKSQEKKANFLWCSPNMAEIFIDKWETKKLLAENWFLVSKWETFKWWITKVLKIIFEKKFNFPVLIKEVDNVAWQWIFVCRNYSDLENVKFNFEKKYVLEEFIQWEEYSGILFSYNWKKIIFPPIYKWKTWFNENWKIIHSLQKLRTTEINDFANEEVREIVWKIWDLEWVNWFIDIDFVFDENDKKFKILEINPRTSWVLDLGFKWSSFSMNDIIDFVLEENSIVWDTNLVKNKIIVEFPIVFENSDFVPVDIELFWWKILKNDFLRKFPPYTQKILLEFENKEDYNNFLEAYNQK